MPILLELKLIALQIMLEEASLLEKRSLKNKFIIYETMINQSRNNITTNYKKYVNTQKTTN